MNQGNGGQFVGDNGVWQDGALLIHYPVQSQWVGFFLAFQSQSWHTDDRTGHIIPVAGDAADRRVRIVAALVNPVGPAPELETVTLLNSTPDSIDLTGWSVADRLKHRFALPAESLGPGATLQVTVRQPVSLGNKGGLITLLDGQGLKVDGVAYTAADARRAGPPSSDPSDRSRCARGCDGAQLPPVCPGRVLPSGRRSPGGLA